MNSIDKSMSPLPQPPPPSPGVSRFTGIVSGAECVWAGLLIAVVTWSTFAGSVPDEPISLGTWIVLPGSTATVVSPHLRFDSSATVLLLIAACLTLLRLPEARSIQTWRAAVGRLALLPLTACAILTTDLVALLVLWCLLDGVLVLASAGGDGPADRRASDSATGSSPFMLLRLSSACLLASVLVGVSRFHSTDLLELAKSAAADGRVDAVPVAAGLSICLGGAAAIRCGLFPSILWLRQYFTSVDRPDVSRILLVTVLPGFALVTRLGGLATTAAEGAMLLAGLGAMTVVVAGMIAVTQKSWRMTVSLLSISVVALGCVGSVSVAPDHSVVVLRSLLVQIPLLAMLLLLPGDTASRAG